MTAVVEELQFVQRMVDAWNGIGPWPFDDTQRAALLAIEALPQELATITWSELQPDERLALLRAIRHMIDLGRRMSRLT